MRFGIHRVGNIQQDAVAGTRAGRQPDRRIDRDVVALVRQGGGLRTLAVGAALPEAVQRSGLRIGENARAVDDLRLFRVRQRHLDDVDAEQRGLGIVSEGSPPEQPASSSAWRTGPVPEI